MSDKVNIANNVAWRIYPQYTVVLKIANGQYPYHTLIELNGPAANIWKVIAQSMQVSYHQIVSQLGDAYDVNREQLKNDTEIFLAKAMTSGIIDYKGGLKKIQKTKPQSFNDTRTNHRLFITHYHRFQKECIPFEATLELNTSCNQRCIHCYNNNHKEEGLSKEWIFEILDQLSELGTLILILTGGEPLMRKDFFELAAYAREKGFALKIYTNATLINEGIAKEISKMHPMIVETTLYGVSAKVHERITRLKGSFHRTTQGIRLLKEYRVPVGVKFILMKENFKENFYDVTMREIKDYITKELGVGFYGIGSVPLLPKQDGSKAPLRHMVNHRQLMEYLSEIKKFIPYKEKALSTVRRDKEVRECICGSGRTTIHIDSQGNLAPCLLAELEGWNIKEHSIKDYLKHSLKLRQIRAIKREDLTACNTCLFRKFCVLVCIAMNKKICGSYTTPIGIYCEISRTYARIFSKNN